MPFAFQNGDVVAIMGNGLPDRMQHDGWMETLLQSELQGKQVRFRNMSVSGDRPDSFPRSSGAMSMTEYLQYVKADVVFAFFGYNESFDGVEKAADYQKKLVEFVRKTRGSKANGKSFPRIVLFSPIAHEDTGNPNVPDGKAHNLQLEAYTAATEAAAKEAGVAFVDLFHPSLMLFEAAREPLTINGVHLTPKGIAFWRKSSALHCLGNPSRLRKPWSPCETQFSTVPTTGTTVFVLAMETTSGADAPR
jgi:lysophospholipase L1-like esterase